MKSLTTAGLILSTTLLSVPGLAATATTTKTTTTTTSSGTVPGAADDKQGAPGTITDTRIHTRDPDLSVLLWLPWYYGFGIGGQVRFEIPILPDGFIPAINDEFAIEPSFGVDWYNYGGGFNNSVGTLNFAPAVYGIWRFHFSEEFSAYGGLGLGINIGTYSGDYFGYNPIYFYWDVVAGLNYMIGKSTAFRAEIGPQGLKAGLSFYF